ncbi:MAG: 1,4-dihydroxy-2-naphthoate octaprenyltransferase [Crocinitomicaceae bacterium]|nr:1,4-dihydroxy-2-naphthoate octaprenyltransferase [Crocinitomicaceae bacterium]MDG1777659.1 1,4-dihydroxy-2-naphthoate octaprenyltransferase [Crocinitomicaceae bacterium]
MSKNKAWISALRLRTLPLSLSGILLGSGAAHYNGYWDTTIFSLAMVTTILFQIVSNLANDLGDGMKGTDNKERIGPERAVQSGIISQKAMKAAVILTALLSLVSAMMLIYFGATDMPKSIIIYYIILAVTCVIAAITYTIGKKAYGYHGMGDIMVFIFFGAVSVLGVYSLYAKSFLNVNLLLAIFVGLQSTAVLNLNNMRDYHNDAASNKNTLVVKLGQSNAKIYHLLLVLTALVSLTLFLDHLRQPLAFLVLLPSILLFIHLRKVMKVKNPKEFDPELKKVALTTFALSLTTTILLFLL